MIKLLVSALLLLQTSSFAATASVRDTDLLTATDYNTAASRTAASVTEPETNELIIMGLCLMGMIAFRRQVTA